jgi:hypothetical protein
MKYVCNDQCTFGSVRLQDTPVFGSIAHSGLPLLWCNAFDDEKTLNVDSTCATRLPCMIRGHHLRACTSGHETGCLLTYT